MMLIRWCAICNSGNFSRFNKEIVVCSMGNSWRSTWNRIRVFRIRNYGWYIYIYILISSLLVNYSSFLASTRLSSIAPLHFNIHNMLLIDSWPQFVAPIFLRWLRKQSATTFFLFTFLIRLIASSSCFCNSWSYIVM